RWSKDALRPKRLDLVAAPLSIFRGDSPGGIRSQRLRHKRRRQHRKRLRARKEFAFNSTLRDRAFAHRKKRLSSRAIEDKHVTHLCSNRDGRDFNAVSSNRYQRRLSRHVVVPHVVMNDLKTPDYSSG